MSSSKQIQFTGYAKLPDDIADCIASDHLYLVLIIDVNNGKILGVDCSLEPEVARNHLAALLTGQCLLPSSENIFEIINNRYQGIAKKAIITAMRIASDKFRAHLLKGELSIRKNNNKKSIHGPGQKVLKNTAWFTVMHILNEDILAIL